jgi:ubiquinone biosynthesis protein UbiJ
LDALQTALRPVAALLNRQIRSKSPARELCRKLEGRTVAVRVRNTSLAVFLDVNTSGISLSDSYVDEPDVAISGSLLSLLGLFRSQSQDLIRDGQIELTGDAHIAEQLQKLFFFARPDPEEELSRYVGDIAAHGIGEVARGIEAWGRDATSTLRQNLSEYLQEESRVLPSRYEIERFRTHVDTLRDDVARFEARLVRLQSLLPDTSPETGRH